MESAEESAAAEETPAEPAEPPVDIEALRSIASSIGVDQATVPLWRASGGNGIGG